MKIKRVICLILAVILAAGCAAVSAQTPAWENRSFYMLQYNGGRYAVNSDILSLMALEDTQEEAIKAAIVAGLTDWENTISEENNSGYIKIMLPDGVTDADDNDINMLFEEVIYEHPQLGIVKGVSQPELEEEDETYSIYAMTYLKNDISAFYEEIDSLAAKVNPYWSDFDKLLYLNDYFALNYTAAMEASNISPIQLTLNKVGSPKSMAIYMAILLERLRFEHQLLFGNLHIVDSEISYAWNKVNLDGSWYHLDPYYGITQMQNNSGDTSYMRKGFLVDDAAMEEAASGLSGVIGTSCGTAYEPDAEWRSNAETTIDQEGIHFTPVKSQNMWGKAELTHDGDNHTVKAAITLMQTENDAAITFMLASYTDSGQLKEIEVKSETPSAGSEVTFNLTLPDTDISEVRLMILKGDIPIWKPVQLTITQ